MEGPSTSSPTALQVPHLLIGQREDLEWVKSGLLILVKGQGAGSDLTSLSVSEIFERASP